MPRIAPSRGTHVTVARRGPAARRRGLHRPGRRGAHDLRAALVRAHADRHHRQRLRRATSTTSSPAGDDIDYLLEAANAFFGTELGRADLTGAYAGRAAADLDRRPAQVGRHLAQGGALRDLLGAAHDHRRQAHHLAADGEAGRSTGWSSARAARRPAARTRSRSGCRPTDAELEPPAGWPGRAARRLPRAARVPLRPRRAQRARAAPASAPSWPRRSSPASPTCSPRPWSRRGSSRRARVADVLLRRTRLGAARRARSCEAPSSVAPVAGPIGAELGWSARRVREEARAWPDAARPRASTRAAERSRPCRGGRAR